MLHLGEINRWQWVQNVNNLFNYTSDIIFAVGNVIEAPQSFIKSSATAGILGLSDNECFNFEVCLFHELNNISDNFFSVAL